MPRSDQAKREWCNLPKVKSDNEDCSKQGMRKQYYIYFYMVRNAAQPTYEARMVQSSDSQVG